MQEQPSFHSTVNDAGPLRASTSTPVNGGSAASTLPEPLLRDAFESWARCNHLDTHLAADGDYFDAQTAAAWFTWRGAMSARFSGAADPDAWRCVEHGECFGGNCIYADHSVAANVPPHRRKLRRSCESEDRMNANDSAFLATLRDEFNMQSRDERIRTGRFMTCEAVMELLRERRYAAAAVQRIDARISAVLDAERNRATEAA